MSWSVYGKTGTVAEVKAQLTDYSTSLTGASKQEFDEALPHINGLLDQIVGEPMNVQFSGNGHATFKDGVKVHGSINIDLKRLA